LIFIPGRFDHDPLEERLVETAPQLRVSRAVDLGYIVSQL
jgi:hypothetical protein